MRQVRATALASTLETFCPKPKSIPAKLRTNETTPKELSQSCQTVLYENAEQNRRTRLQGNMSALQKREKGDSTKRSASSIMFYKIVLFINFKETTETIEVFKE